MAKDKVPRYRAKRRKYPKVGKVDTIHDVKEIIRAVKKDRISQDRKRKRLQFLYSLTFSKPFKKGFKGSVVKARSLLKNAYRRYVKR